MITLLFEHVWLISWYHYWKIWSIWLKDDSDRKWNHLWSQQLASCSASIYDHITVIHSAVFSILVFYSFIFCSILLLKRILYPWLDAFGNKWHQDCEVWQPRLGICSRINEPNPSQHPADWNPIRGPEAGAGGSWKESAQYGEEKGTGFSLYHVNLSITNRWINYVFVVPHPQRSFP